MTSRTTPYEEFQYAVTSSAAIPTVFPPIAFQGKLLMDGGTIWNTNVQQAIDMCTQDGFEDSEITVDILICSTADTIIEWEESSSSAIRNYERSMRLGKSYKGVDTIEAVKRAHPDINWRHLIEANNAQRVNGLSELDFTTETTAPLIQAGKCEAMRGLAEMDGTAMNPA